MYITSRVLIRAKSPQPTPLTIAKLHKMAEEDLALDLTGKKKKVKKTNPLPLDEPQQDEGAAIGGAVPDTMATDELILPEKKKKKERVARPAEEKEEEQKVSAIAEGIGHLNLIDAKDDWPDYAYEELVNMVFDVMREKNPDYLSSKKDSHHEAAECRSSWKQAFTNFAEICRILKRQPKHVLTFILAELGTTGSIDGNQCLIVKGRFQQKHFESVLRKYIRYVTCHTCRSSDTELIKDTRLFFLQCKVCESKCSVSAIKTGYTAMVGKRAAQRRANEITGVNK